MAEWTDINLGGLHLGGEKSTHCTFAAQKAN